MGKYWCDACESATAVRNSPRLRGEDTGMKNQQIVQFLFALLRAASKRVDKYLLIVALCISTCGITGCVDSVNYLASDSRLPKWFTLPPGLTRADVTVVRASMDPTRRGDMKVALYHSDIKVALYKGKYKKLAEVSGKSIWLGYFGIDVVDGVPEITGYKAQMDEHGNRMPYFYVVDDPALKRRLLDEYEKELLGDNRIDYPALRKKTLDEN
jgi:hypothetical protein